MRPKLCNTLSAFIGAFLFATLACSMGTAEPTSDIAQIISQTQTAIAINRLLVSTVSPPVEILTPTPTTQIAISTETPPNTPAASPTKLECTKQAKFVNETIPDGISFAPGDTFEKTWALKNTGTCTWTTGYALVFIQGDQMGGASPIYLTQEISPNDITEISASMTAPSEEGEYQGFWKLQSTDGEQFGLGKNSDVAFWVKINVAELGDDLNQGPPDWVDTFESDHSNWYLGADEHISFEIVEGSLVMTAHTPSGDRWRVAEIGSLDDLFLESHFKTGDNCNGKDSYGLIVRANDQADNLIDSGYVFSFSCDGHYRMYRMDNGSYYGLVNWTSHPNIKSGPSQTNLMGIKAEGANLQLYANGFLVNEVNDGAYLSGLFGLMIRSDSTSNFQVIVKQIAYWLTP